MSSSKKQLAAGSGQRAVPGRRRRVLYCLLLTAYCLLFLGCRQDMQDQPRYEVYESSRFFNDGLSSRRPVEGTVARGLLMADKQLYTGKMDKAGAATTATTTTGSPNTSGGQQGSETTSARDASGGGEGGEAGAQSGNTASGTQAMGGSANANTQRGALPQGTDARTAVAGADDDADTFPFPVTAEVMERGRERYEIFCAMCHGYTGEGDGMIVRRGYRKPPSYHEDRLRQARAGYFFRVMTEGFGAMPPYRAQVPVQDRWAIAAYIRALQLSRSNQQQGAPATGNPGAETGGHR